MTAWGRRMRLDDEAGVGMVELFIVMLLTSVIGATLLNGMVSSFRHQRQQVDYVQTLNTMKLAFERTTMELRAADPLVAASAESVTVRVRRGPETARTCQDVQFALTPAGATSNLTTQNPVGSAARTVAAGFRPVTAGLPTFRYLDKNQAVLSAPVAVANVRYIEINLRATLTDPANPIAFRDRIFLRNRGGRGC